jgi:hypothetical protein
MTVHSSLSEEKALMSQTTSEQIGSVEERASKSVRQAIAVYATSLTLVRVPLVSAQIEFLGKRRDESWKRFWKNSTRTCEMDTSMTRSRRYRVEF